MRGNQIPRIKIEPARTGTDGKGAAMLMQAYGCELDPWQELILDCWLGKDETGSYNVTSAGLSMARQNGKTELLIARCFYGLVVNGERILFTAHQMRSVKKVFNRLVNMFTDKRHPEILAAVRRIRYGLGEESIELLNGGLIEFTSRSRQVARGYEGISLVVYDECAELTDDQAESIMSTLSASKTGTRQLLYVGTPPYPGCTGEVFGRFRQSCIISYGKGEARNVSWHEWSIAADSLQEVDLADKALWYQVNPALGYRLTEEFTAEEFNTLSPIGFARERLGLWMKNQSSTTGSELAIEEELWDSCRSDEERPDGKVAYGVKFTPDGSEVVLAGAVIAKDGKARITLLAAEPTGKGISWLAEWLNDRYKTASCVVIDGRNGSDVLIDKIRDTWKLRDSVIKPSAQNVIAAASLLKNELIEKTVTWYSKQDLLRESAITSTKRSISGGWGFGGQTSAPIEACSLALWGCRTSKRNPSKKMRIG
ncbi:MAG: hypothetical protein II918_02505 [Firmicutes bacterium]|nr:hypothetical protein [Bacillota bacterium]